MEPFDLQTTVLGTFNGSTSFVNYILILRSMIKM